MTQELSFEERQKLLQKYIEENPVHVTEPPGKLVYHVFNSAREEIPEVIKIHTILDMKSCGEYTWSKDWHLYKLESIKPSEIYEGCCQATFTRITEEEKTLDIL